MAKTEVYSWRVDPQIKMALEAEARRQRRSVADVLDMIAKEWLASRKADDWQDDAEQARLHAAAAKWIGSISGGDPHRSQKVRETVRKRLRERYGR